MLIEWPADAEAPTDHWLSEVQRMVRYVQETLRRVGGADMAATLEQPLMDFAIGDVHPMTAHQDVTAVPPYLLRGPSSLLDR
ncbi:hypothetical protein ACIP2Y_44995 [Streptomyces sviceus]|uniref:hypothetical protein n=1 Tax=Streptomyces sviceus TaxID=285530 RepID=UPI00381DAE2D